MAESPRQTAATIYHSYRIILAVLLLALSIAAHYGIVPDRNLPESFLIISAIYLFEAICIPLLPKRLLLAGFIVDVAVTILLVHFSSSLGGSLSVILLVIVASANIIMTPRLGLLLASVATLSILGEQLWSSLLGDSHVNFPTVGLMGMAFFAVSLLVQQLVNRLRRSEELGEEQRQAIAQLEELNYEVVSRLRTGIIVFDKSLTILTVNPAAQRIFDTPLQGTSLPKPLATAYRNWQAQPNVNRPSLGLSPEMPPMLASFAHLHPGENSDSLTVLFLEDEARLAQEAQHLKLASLGRMSAMIAHEIRNPLSAIQQASDLLAEEGENEDNAPLFRILRSHTKRLNDIISDILNLSRREVGQSKKLELGEQAQKALEQLAQGGVDVRHIETHLIDPTLVIRFSENQLQQVIQNLIRNALIHGGDNITVTLSSGVHPRSDLPWLSISDNGKGIAEADQEHLFEPFFTTSHNGTGLGLYLCRELCEANQAQLVLNSTGSGASFMITFAHSDRLFQ